MGECQGGISTCSPEILVGVCRSWSRASASTAHIRTTYLHSPEISNVKSRHTGPRSAFDPTMYPVTFTRKSSADLHRLATTPLSVSAPMVLMPARSTAARHDTHIGSAHITVPKTPDLSAAAEHNRKRSGESDEIHQLMGAAAEHNRKRSATTDEDKHPQKKRRVAQRAQEISLIYSKIRSLDLTPDDLSNPATSKFIPWPSPLPHPATAL